MLRRSITLGLIAIFFDWFSAPPYQAATAGSRDSCEPVGRVLNGRLLNFGAGSIVCKGDRLQVAKGGTAELLCFPSGQVLVLSTNTYLNDASKCGRAIIKTSPCAATRRRDCIKPKGPGEGNNRPVLITPYGNTLLEDRPLLSWATVPGADVYIVEVGNKNELWQQTVNAVTRLIYPTDAPAMEPGHAYKITIIAMRSNSVVSASETVVNLLNEKDARLVKAKVERINQVKLSKDEAAYLDLNSIYRAKNLLDEAINTLKAQAQAGSQNPAIYRTLGDRYLEAGLPDYAKKQYKIATTLARSDENSIELGKAQAGLEAVEVALVSSARR